MAAPGARVELLRLGERGAYTDETLARVIREGIAPDGRRLGFLMPCYRIDDADMASLIAYLKQLSRQPSPGVGDDTLQFATIITPDADPLKRRGMLDVLEHFFGRENVFSGGKSPPPQLSRRFIPIAHRWQLHVWEVTGAPESWEAQLDERLRREPVFAAISGIGGSTWEPVHRFCERSALPCLFPNVDLPVVAERDFYDVYLSKGVLLEAQLIADRLRQADPAGSADTAATEATGAKTSWRRLVQVYRHRRSGIGVNEGRITIPPITGKYLFSPGERAKPEAQTQSPGASVTRHERYDDAKLVRAIREGINADGKPMSYLMPRFALSNADAGALVDYLKTLSTEAVPGASHDDLDFATIVTPDADPTERSGMIDVLTHFFSNKNDFERGHDPALVSARRIHYRVVRKWRLHVWDLTGAPDSWEAQLKAHFAAEPVFAVISGLGGREWGPVHRFCEEQGLPCLFPNVPLPVVSEKDFYPLYFSRGVLLEADLIRTQLDPQSGARGHRVLQVYRRGDIGEAAAHALRSRFADQASEWLDLTLPAARASGDVRRAVASVQPGDTAVLWLRGEDLRELPIDPPKATVFASGLMGGLESAPLPAGWRSGTRIAYPMDLPQKRAIRLVYPLTWFKTQHVPVVAERVQVDTYVACQVLSEALGHAFGDLVPDYIIEQIENMVSLKLIDGYYPRLGLAPGQRFASKGGIHRPPRQRTRCRGGRRQRVAGSVNNRVHVARWPLTPLVFGRAKQSRAAPGRDQVVRPAPGKLRLKA